MSKLRIAQYGCGKMSKYSMRYVYEKGAEIVAAFDVNPAVVGRDIGSIMGGPDRGVVVQPASEADKVLAALKPDACIITTMSLMRDIAEALMVCAKNGVNAITTNETSFFRDEHPFSAFKEKLLPELMAKVAERKARPWQRRGPKAMLWSAACSTGQEAYSLAMAIHDGVAYGGRGDIGADDFGILASDISSRVLAKAMLGRYNALEVARGLSPELRQRYMAAEQGEYVVQEKIRQMVEFRTVNLQEPFTHVGAFDIIFCRNILIYFSESAKQQILRQMLQMLSPGGVLMLGSAENMYGLDLGYVSETYGSTVYYRKNA